MRHQISKTIEDDIAINFDPETVDDKNKSSFPIQKNKQNNCYWYNNVIYYGQKNKTIELHDKITLYRL